MKCEIKHNESLKFGFFTPRKVNLDRILRKFTPQEEINIEYNFDYFSDTNGFESQDGGTILCVEISHQKKVYRSKIVFEPSPSGGSPIHSLNEAKEYLNNLKSMLSGLYGI